MKYYLIFINTLNGFEVVGLSTFDDYESQQKALNEYKAKLDQNGFDWLGSPHVEYHEVQTLSEVS